MQVARCSAGLKEVAGLKKLSTLVLFKTQVTDAGLTGLEPLRHLTRLDLASTGLGDEGTAALTVPRPARLVALDLGMNRIGAEGVGALVGSGRLTGLHHLGLFGFHDPGGHDAGDHHAAVRAGKILRHL